MLHFLRKVFSLENIASDVRNVFVTLMTVGAFSAVSALFWAVVKSVRQEPIPWSILIGLMILGLVLISIALVIAFKRAKTPEKVSVSGVQTERRQNSPEAETC